MPYQNGQGNLVIEALQEHPAGSECWYGPYQYTSGRITTSGHLALPTNESNPGSKSPTVREYGPLSDYLVTIMMGPLVRQKLVVYFLGIERQMYLLFSEILVDWWAK